MNRLCVETRGIASWRERLASPDRQWKRRFSAFETAVSWELASNSESGLPEPIESMFQESSYCQPLLCFAVAEHKVPLPGGNADSQCDVWALLNTEAGKVSLSVEAKAQEPFGRDNEPLERWLVAGNSEASGENRQKRWEYLRQHLPSAEGDGYSQVAYQLLHRCAAGVIEARRLHIQNAVFVVQAFHSSLESFGQFSVMCRVMGIKAARGQMQMTSAGDVQLGLGWVDCHTATDEQVASVV